ncbi:MAG: ATP-dependent 6-phosphofructokinase [Deltaproteobacteria bacterium]|nr:ATP-dependent 6-phosphofructokinase [Deltaproteobacteria bacterium]
MTQAYNFSIDRLGKCSVPSPINLSKTQDQCMAKFVTDELSVIYNVKIKSDNLTRSYNKENLLEMAGPREMIYFDPLKLHAAIVTCGGLCPGINDVIRSIVMCLWHHYGVRRISGIEFGYRGFLPEFRFPVVDLTPEKVVNIHKMGGTILGTSRGGGEQTAEIVDTLERMNLNVVFIIGGDGTQKGALAITKEVKKRNLKISVIGIPKTIDNDLGFVQKSFGFETAVSAAVSAVSGAHTEAHDSINGIGLVKVMGRESGFIAAHTALAMNDVNYVLIPEVPFDLEGANGLLRHLQHRLRIRNHAMILVAEGAGQNHLQETGLKDVSGNKTLADIGLFLKTTISEFFKSKKTEVNIKYIDPSYIIRSAHANPSDSIFCARLGNNAVHAALSGRTGAMISLINNQYVHVPLELVVSKRNKVDPESSLWRDVVSLTGQPALMTNKRF